ncbi:hypothetical protein CFOL_v3_34265, partial [Cephalotus follicularis]
PPPLDNYDNSSFPRISHPKVGTDNLLFNSKLKTKQHLGVGFYLLKNPGEMASKAATAPYPRAARISDSPCYPQYTASLKCKKSLFLKETLTLIFKFFLYRN